MPFGVKRPDVQLLFESWVPGIEIEEVEMPMERLDGLMLWIVPLFMTIPYLKRMQPGSVLRVTFPPKYCTRLFSLNSKDRSKTEKSYN